MNSWHSYEPWVDETISVNPLPDDKILDRSKLKQTAGDSNRFDENSRMFSKWVENTVGKGEIAHYEQFLLFPQCFQKACFAGASKGMLCGNGLTLSQTSPGFYMSAVQFF